MASHDTCLCHWRKQWTASNATGCSSRLWRLGALAVFGDQLVAAAGGAALAAVLASREMLHGLLRRLTWIELRSTIVLAAMTAIVLPLLPDRTVDPWAGSTRSRSGSSASSSRRYPSVAMSPCACWARRADCSSDRSPARCFVYRGHRRTGTSGQSGSQRDAAGGRGSACGAGIRPAGLRHRCAARTAGHRVSIGSQS